MTVKTNGDNIVRLPKWFAVTILSGAVSFAGFAVSVISNNAREALDRIEVRQSAILEKLD